MHVPETEVFAARRTAIQLTSRSQSPERTTAQRFFLALDAATRPGRVNQRCGKVPLLMHFLKRRLDARIDGLFGAATKLPRPTEAETRAAMNLARLMEELILEYYGDGRQVDVEAFFYAFSRFASGELALFEDEGAPNGSSFLFFAESALLYRELDDQRTEFWDAVVAVMVCSCEVFFHCYWNGGRRERQSYKFGPHVQNSFKGTHWEYLWRAFRLACSTPDRLEQDFERILASHLRDEVPRK